MIRIKDIANKAGVSPTTVSNVIHGNTKRVSPGTIEKIQAILQDSNYVPSMAARLLSQNSSNIIGVIIGYRKSNQKKISQDPFVGEIIGALEEDIRNRGYFMMLYAAEATIDIFKLASTWKVAGLIILGFSEKDCINLRKQTDTPFVTIDCYFDKYKNQFVNVGLDDYHGGYLIGKHIAQYGHKKILYMAGGDWGVAYYRWMGFLKALKESNVSCDEKNFVLVERNEKERENQYIQMLPTIREQTAMIFDCDLYAAEAMNFLRERNIKVPEDISITGFDDNIYADGIRPKLTTIKQDVTKKAVVAMEYLFYLIEGEEDKILDKDIKLPVELICRDSVKNIT